MIKRLNDVTSDAYTKFNDEDGIQRMHTALKILAPLTIRDKDCVEKEMLSDGRIKYTIYPEDSRRQAKVSATFLAQLGVGVEIHCPHGVTGTVKSVPDSKRGAVKSTAEKQGSSKRRKINVQKRIEQENASEKEEASLPQVLNGQMKQPKMPAAAIEKVTFTAEKPAEAPEKRATTTKGKTKRTKEEKQLKTQESFYKQLSLFDERPG